MVHFSRFPNRFELFRLPVHLTLVLPQLIWPEPEDKTAQEGLPCPGLEWLLAHGRFTRNPAIPYEEALAALFGLDAGAPFGALRLLGETRGPDDPDPGSGFWLCADPVHLRFHHERIILADAGAFDLGDEEALTLAEGLNREFADIGEFHVADTRRWYARLKAGSDFDALPLSAVAGRRMSGDLPDNPRGSPLRPWLNEMQMFLHGHPVNAARAGAGKPAVNSLWLWGGGELPKSAGPGHAGLWSADPLATGLARAFGIPAHPLPAGLDKLFAAAPAGSTQVAVLDSLLPPVLYENPRAWRDALADLEKHWFAPLRPALGRQVGTIVLLAPTIYGLLRWEIGGGERWKFWRRSAPLAATAQALAQ